MTILDSSSALQRFKNRNALHMSSPDYTSSFILMCKIKKILNKEFTDELFDRYLNEYGFVEKSKVDRAGKIQQFVIRLEKLAAPHLLGILNEYAERGIWGMVGLISQPVAKLIHITSKKRDEELTEVC